MHMRHMHFSSCVICINAYAVPPMSMVDFDVPVIEGELAQMGVPVAELCRRAGIDTSTWQRWKTERFEPRMSMARKVLTAMEAIRAERDIPAHTMPHPNTQVVRDG